MSMMGPWISNVFLVSMYMYLMGDIYVRIYIYIYNCIYIIYISIQEY